MESSQSKLEAAYDYTRMCLIMGADGSMTNSILYEDYIENMYMCWQDLSTDQSVNLCFLIPSTRRGIVALRMQFSVPTYSEMVMLVYAEQNVTMGIDKDRKILINYTV